VRAPGLLVYLTCFYCDGRVEEDEARLTRWGKIMCDECRIDIPREDR
jgi:hypothetical protein